ncbi:MAG: carbon starvation protein A [Bacteroidales bacterium]|nr:carbon starvation protein A [Bacteroidales bacterium]
MITFILSIIALVLGYVLYGKFAERVFGPDPARKTPAYTKQDGVDFMPMPTWKIFMIQFLNIAGLGPIFGAILGAQFGTAAYIWIVVGCIFIGAFHDYFSGMISLREGGANLPEIIGKYLGSTTKTVMRVFTVILLVLVGVVFVSQPAGILDKITPDWMNNTFWIVVIFAYYLIATLLPIDKVIGKVYPLFAFALIFMAVGVLFMIFWNGIELPEITDGIANSHPHKDTTPIFPIMCITIACGAISGFHATQSPLMARCLKNENLGRPVFYGAMILEGIIAMIWAAAAIWYYKEKGYGESQASIVYFITETWMGKVGSILAMLGVVFAPIPSGDTALRSARLIIADFFKMDQSKISQRLMISVPVFIATALIIVYSLSDAAGFNVIWRYFGWSNQALSVFTLWSITVYMVINRKPWIMAFLPALYMTVVCSTYLFIAPECLHLAPTLSYILGGVCGAVAIAMFFVWKNKQDSKTMLQK